MHDKEVIKMMERCANEIRSLRKEVDRLAPQAEAYNLVRDVVNLIPKASRGYGEDLVWLLENKIKELQAEPVKDAQ